MTASTASGEATALDRARRGEFESTTVSLAILLADARGWLVT